MNPMKEKWQAFGWHVIVTDGHDIEKLMTALDEVESVKNKPTVIIANTVKGKGVSFIENNNKFHGTVPTEEELGKALKELDAELKKI